MLACRSAAELDWFMPDRAPGWSDGDSERFMRALCNDWLCWSAADLDWIMPGRARDWSDDRFVRALSWSAAELDWIVCMLGRALSWSVAELGWIMPGAALEIVFEHINHLGDTCLFPSSPKNYGTCRSGLPVHLRRCYVCGWGCSARIKCF